MNPIRRLSSDDHPAVPPDPALRVKALESLLVAKGLVDSAALDALIDTYEHKVGPRNGARVVARAWVDPAYRQRLLTNATAAIAELGYSGSQGEHMVALENMPKAHNLVVCTLCSCYPWPVLGLPPVWYKSAPYRSRAVIDPRGLLRDFGLELPEDVEVRVWADSRMAGSGRSVDRARSPPANSRQPDFVAPIRRSPGADRERRHQATWSGTWPGWLATRLSHATTAG